MDNRMRWNITLRVWLAAFIVGIFISTPWSPSLPITITTAIVATVFIWGGLVLEAILKRVGASITPQKQVSKSGIDDRAYKLAVLLEMMDDDEREEFKHKLKNDLIGGGDSESLSLDSLITEKRKRS